MCREYDVEFKVRYSTNPGQELYVMGSINELGNWRDFACKMTEIEDDLWITDNLRISSATYFQYKYVVRRCGTHDAIWEKGMDRIADLAILPLVRQSKDGQLKYV